MTGKKFTLQINDVLTVVRQAERADFSELMICQIFSTDVKKHEGVHNYVIQLYNFVTIHRKFLQIWTVPKPYKGKTIKSLEIGRENVIFFGRKPDISHRIHNKIFIYSIQGRLKGVKSMTYLRGPALFIFQKRLQYWKCLSLSVKSSGKILEISKNHWIWIQVLAVLQGRR